MRTGGCLCGAVRLEAEGEPKWVAFCHCRSCRKATGAPVTAYAGFEMKAVRWTSGAPRFLVSSPGVRRGFCGNCGSPLTYEGDRWPGEIHLHLGCLDQADLVPTAHAFEEEKLPWLDVRT